MTALTRTIRTLEKPALPDDDSLAAAEQNADAILAVVTGEKELHIEILNDRGLAQAGALLKDIKREYKEIDAEREKVVKPLHALHQWANGLFTPALRLLTEKEAKLKTMIGAYTRKKEDEQRKLLAAAAQEARAVAAQAHTLEQARTAVTASANVQVALQKAQAAQVKKVEGISVGEKWHAQLEDGRDLPDSEVPLEYWSVDQSKLDAAVKSGVRSIPGVRIYSEASVRVRT